MNVQSETTSALQPGERGIKSLASTFGRTTGPLRLSTAGRTLQTLTKFDEPGLGTIVVPVPRAHSQ
jgi:hypothetical protein